MSILNPTTYLDLVQRYAIEAGVTDDPPSTLVGANAQLLTLMLDINDAWRRIQMLHDDWAFMRISPGVSFTTVADQTKYTVAQTGIGAGTITKWLGDTFRVYKTATGTSSEIPMTQLGYDEWRDLHFIGALRTARVQPINFAVHPDLSIMIPNPLAGYTITGDYQTTPIGLEVDADIPALPNKFIMAIVWDALMAKYSVSESSPEMFAKGSQNYNSIVGKMELSQLPGLYMAGAIA